jgi:hypothetical protein
MPPRIVVSPAEKRNVTIDRRPPIKSIEICTSLKSTNSCHPEKNGSGAPEKKAKFQKALWRCMLPVKMPTVAENKLCSHRRGLVHGYFAFL